MNINDYKDRVAKALGKYLEREACPLCGAEHWNGSIHPFGGGTFQGTRFNALWCDGKRTFKLKRKDKVEKK